MSAVPPASAPAVKRPKKAPVDYATLALKRVRTLITPEGVDLRLSIAEIGDRVAAFLIDTVLVSLLLAVFTVGAIYAAGAVGFRGAGEIILSIVWLAHFVMRYAWYIFFEMRPKAATPGKRVMKVRVAARDGGRLTAEAVFVRNAMREAEYFIPLQLIVVGAFGQDVWSIVAAWGWIGIFLLFPLFNRDRLRVGDLLAGTWVVKAPRQKLLADLSEREAAVREQFDFTPEQAAAYGEKELTILEEVLRGKDQKVRGDVAARIRRKIGWARRQGETDAAFLDAYYAALRRRLEGGLLVGKRKKDKFDTGVRL